MKIEDHLDYQKNLQRVKGYSLYLKSVPEKYKTKEMCLAAVGSSGWALEYVDNQTEKICLTAVNNHGRSLQHVKNQTDAICLAAVSNNGKALEYVIQQNYDICMAAVKQDAFALEYVKQQTPEICLAAVRNNGIALTYSKMQTKQICLEAVLNNRMSIIYVNDLPSIAESVPDDYIDHAISAKDKASDIYQNLKDIKARLSMIDSTITTIDTKEPPVKIRPSL